MKSPTETSKPTDDKISEAKKSESYLGYLSQKNQTPIKNFINEYPHLKGQNTDVIFGFEVASPKLREYIRAWCVVNDLNKSASNSSSSIGDEKAVANKDLLAASIELFLTQTEKDEAEELKKRKEKIANGIPLIPTKASNDTKEIQAKKYAAPLNKTMLVASLRNDFPKFKKAFKDFEAIYCRRFPDMYVQGFGDAKATYDLLQQNAGLSLKDYALLSTTESADDSMTLRAKFSSEHYLEISLDHIESCLKNQNKVENSDHKDFPAQKAKSKVFIFQAAKKLKSELQADISTKKQIIKTYERAQRNAGFNALVFFGFITLIVGIGVVILAICDLLSILSRAAEQDIGNTRNQLEESQNTLDKIKAAEGLFSGFYITKELKQVLLDHYTTDNTNLRRAILNTVVDEQPFSVSAKWQGAKDSVSAKWQGAKDSVSAKWQGAKDSFAAMKEKIWSAKSPSEQGHVSIHNSISSRSLSRTIGSGQHLSSPSSSPEVNDKKETCSIK
jgi:hypothetical protein